MPTETETVAEIKIKRVNLYVQTTYLLGHQVEGVHAVIVGTAWREVAQWLI